MVPSESLGIPEGGVGLAKNEFYDMRRLRTTSRRWWKRLRKRLS